MLYSLCSSLCSLCKLPCFSAANVISIQICKFVYLWVRRLLAYSHLSAVSSPTASLLWEVSTWNVFYLLCCGVGLRSLSHGGIWYRSHNGEISVMSRDSSIRERSGYYGNLGSLRAGTRHHGRRRVRYSSAYGVQYPILILLSRASHLYCLELVIFACFATIGQSFDWREPIGLQERLKGRSSHNGEISVMSRSRSQGTEVTIVTGAFPRLQLTLHRIHFETGKSTLQSHSFQPGPGFSGQELLSKSRYWPRPWKRTCVFFWIL